MHSRVSALRVFLMFVLASVGMSLPWGAAVLHGADEPDVAPAEINDDPETMRKEAERLARERETRQRKEEQDMRDADKREKEMARANRWLQYEVDFVEALGSAGYDALAREWLNNTLAMKNLDGTALSSSQKAFLNKATARLKLQRAHRVEAHAEKLALGSEAIELMKQVLENVKNDPSLLEATKSDMVDMYFKLAGHYVDLLLEATETEEGRKAYEAAFALYQRELAAAKKAKKEFSIESLDKSLMAKAGIFLTAVAYYEAAFAIAEPLLETYGGNFEDTQYRWSEARGEYKKLLYKRMERYFILKVNLQHLMEAAYAKWPLLYPRSSDARKELVARAREFIDMVIYDYQDYWPDDKRVYMYWIQILSMADDPIYARDDEGKLLRYIDDDEVKGTFAYYVWYSDLMKFLYNKHIVAGVKGPVDNGQGVRIRALYFYAEAMVRMAAGAFEQIDAQRDEKRKKEWEEHAKGLLEEAEALVKEVCSAETQIGPMEPVLRYSAILKIKTKFNMLLADRVKAAGDEARAKALMQDLLESLGAVEAEAVGGWRVAARNRGLEVKAWAKSRGWEVSTAFSDMATAKTKLIEAVKEKDGQKAEVLLKEARDKYWGVIAEVRGVGDKDRRAAMLPEAWSYYALANLKLGDYYKGYIASFEVMQEFTEGRYPPAKYPKITSHVERARKNLRFAASKQMKKTKSNFDRRLYADALLIEMQENKDPNLVMVLADQFKRLKMYEEAVEYLKQLPSDHLYARIALLMVADIYQTLLKDAIKRVEDIDEALAPAKEGETKAPVSADARSKMEEEKTELMASSKAFREQADLYARKFIEAVAEAKVARKEMDRPPTKTELDVWKQEDENIPSARLIAVWLSYYSKEYDVALKRCEIFLEKMKWPDGFNEDLKAGYISQVHWMRFTSKIYGVDPKTAPVEKVAANLREAGEIQKELAAADQEGDFTSNSYKMMGGLWSNLAGRVQKQMQKQGDTPAPALEAQYKEYRVAAAQWFRNAESLIYLNIKYGLMIGGTFVDNQMYDDAEGIFDRVIQYWEDSLFTPVHLYHKKADLAALKAATIPDEIKDAAGALVDIAALQGAADDKALLAALNKQVREMNAAAKATQAKAVLDYAVKAEEKDRKFQKVLAQAQELLAVKTRSREEEQKLNRVVLESVFSGILARSAPRPRIPDEEVFVSTVRQQMSGSYRSKASRDEQRQDQVTAMHDPEILSESSRKGMLEIVDKLIAGAAGDEKAVLQTRKELMEPGLRTLIYGVEVRGKRQKRDFVRAKMQIDDMFAANDELRTARQPDLPTKDFLRSIQDALEFNASILRAKRRLATAKVALGKYDDALRYLDELVKFYPNNPELMLARVETYTFMGERNSDGTPRAYDEKSAKYFMEARVNVGELLKAVKPYSQLYWIAFEAYFQNETGEILARARSGSAGDATHKISVTLYDKRTEKNVVINESTADKNAQIKRMQSDVGRLMRHKLAPESFREACTKMLDRMEKEGIKKKAKPKEKDAA